jgi:hypothetical protein
MRPYSTPWSAENDQVKMPDISVSWLLSIPDALRSEMNDTTRNRHAFQPVLTAGMRHAVMDPRNRVAAKGWYLKLGPHL